MANPFVLKPLKLHYLRWVLFDVGSGLHIMYQGIFDSDFDKYLEDAVALVVTTGITTASQASKDGHRTGRQAYQPSSSSFGSISARASWKTGNFPTRLKTPNAVCGPEVWAN
jgi:hypothetical protein